MNIFEIFNQINIYLLNIEEPNNKNINEDLNKNLINKKDEYKESIIIKSDKVKFVGKQTKLPVSSFSRAVNFGMLGASILTNTIGNVIVDKV